CIGHLLCYLLSCGSQPVIILMDSVKRKRLMTVSWFLFSVVVVALVVVGIKLKQIQEEFRVLTENELKLNRLSGMVQHLDEVLTMSTHMAAASGDIYWEERYFEHVKELDSVLAEVRHLAPHIYESEANRITESANVVLVKLEMQAFDSVRKGNLEAARAIVVGRPYQEQKRIYSEGIGHLLVGVDQSVESKLNRLRTLMHTLFIGVGITVLCIIAQWGIVLKCSIAGKPELE
ncbi:MAG: hypothetical protein QF371_08230, partial [Flavobacteriales bacterium]|nr:hypothetical protein [Flavobacteriales bacterium]